MNFADIRSHAFLPFLLPFTKKSLVSESNTATFETLLRETTSLDGEYNFFSYLKDMMDQTLFKTTTSLLLPNQ